MKKFLFRSVLVIALVGILALSACSASSFPPAPTAAGPTTAPQTTYAPPPTSTAPRPTITIPSLTSTPASTMPPVTTAIPAPATTSTGTIGLAAGGAKDIANFRENILDNYLPLSTDVTYEGLFNDYYFDTGSVEPTDKLYSPSYCSAVTRDPLSHQTEYYLSVGLNSGLKASDFQRKKLNLVIVLDDSGSMGELYNQYYYDNTGRQVDAYAEEGIYHRNKIQSATEAVNSILDQLNNDDRFAIVTFNSDAHLNKPMGSVSQIDMRDVKNHVLDITAGGSTNLAAGIDMATRQFDNLDDINSYEYENRIFILSDAQPNTGDYSSSGLFNRLADNADNRIYTTFIGIGVDFNSSLVEQITKIKGANYYSVHSPREFIAQMQDDFDYMVTPLVFNLQLNFQSKGWRIEKVFGSPEANESTGRLMTINTLFASRTDSTGQVKGGLILLKLQRISASSESIYLSTSYEDRNGRTDGDTQVINFENMQPEYFANSGIRKGILLTRYAALLKDWLVDERQHAQNNPSWTPCINDDTGITIPVEYPGEWERQSLPLMVSSPYQQIFRNFSQYFTSEMNAIGDKDLGQELDIINTLSRF